MNTEHAARKVEFAKWLPNTDAPDLPHGRGGGEEGDKAEKKAKRKAAK